MADAERVRGLRDRTDILDPTRYLSAGNRQAVPVQDPTHLDRPHPEERILDEGVAAEPEHLDLGIAERRDIGERAFEIRLQGIA
jgi:hypothetical protein